MGNLGADRGVVSGVAGQDMGNFGDETRQNEKTAAEAVTAAHAQEGREAQDQESRAALSPRERDILDAIIAGETSKETARRLTLSPRTVEVHRAHILKKLGAKNTADLLRRVLLDRAKS